MCVFTSSYLISILIVLGDFNVNLLNSDIHRPTEDFTNNMYTYFMNPQIINLQE